MLDSLAPVQEYQRLKPSIRPEQPATRLQKNATTHGHVLNTARVRKKKRRDVNTIAAQSKTTTSLLSMTHVELGDIAEENSEVALK